VALFSADPFISGVVTKGGKGLQPHHSRGDADNASGEGRINTALEVPISRTW
jgi:hypothetical protein